MPFKEIILCSILFSFLFLNTSLSQEIEPRAYANIPKNINIIALGYSYSTGNFVTDPTSPIKELDLSSNTIVGSYIRTFSMLKKLARVQINVPYVFMDGTAKLKGKDTSGTRSGLADARFRFGWNFVGSDAIDAKKFAAYKQGTILGASIVVSIPIGLYYPEKVINLGSNRWGFKPEIGVSWRISQLFVEAYSGIWLFTNNTEYLSTKTISQNPLFSLQANVCYAFPSYIWISAGFGYVYGGQTKVNGVQQDNLQNNKRLGFSVSVPVSRSQSFKLQYNTGIYTRVGGNFDIFTLSFLQTLL